MNARNDPKLIRLSIHGLDLKAIYWDLIEMLHEQGGYLDYDLDSLAFALRADKQRIDTVINFKGLFDIANDKFTCQRVLNNIAFRQKKSEKAHNSAKKRWDNAKAMRAQCEGNAIKERKGKEIKERKEYNTSFESVWSKYPKKLGKNGAIRSFNATVKTEDDIIAINNALTNFLGSRIAKGDPQYIPHGSTWFNNWRDWVDYKDTQEKKERVL